MAVSDHRHFPHLSSAPRLSGGIPGVYPATASSSFSAEDTTMGSSYGQTPLEEATLNPKLLASEYAVRGAIAQKAEEYTLQLKEGRELPFHKQISCNIGACGGPRVCQLSMSTAKYI